MEDNNIYVSSRYMPLKVIKGSHEDLADRGEEIVFIRKDIDSLNEPGAVIRFSIDRITYDGFDIKVELVSNVPEIFEPKEKIISVPINKITQGIFRKKYVPIRFIDWTKRPYKAIALEIATFLRDIVLEYTIFNQEAMDAWDAYLEDEFLRIVYKMIRKISNEALNVIEEL